MEVHKPTPLIARNGYALIEIVIVTTIMALMLGSGIAALLQFQEKQVVTTAANELKVYLRSAQDRARSGDRPEGCDHLLSYAIRTSAGTDQIEMVAVCDNDEFVRKETTLQAEGVTVADSYDIQFLTLHGGVVGATTITLESTANKMYEFEVTTGGEITEGEYGDIE